MPSPIGHAVAGAMVAWIGEVLVSEVGAPVRGRSVAARLADSFTPLAVACAVLGVAPDFDNFFHSHRTFSHSLGAAAFVWAVAALFARWFRLPVLATATICAAAYSSHVLLDWLGRDGPPSGVMALWPLTAQHYTAGLNVFRELLVHPRAGLVSTALHNLPALAREAAVLGPPFLLAWLIRVKAPSRLAPEVARRDEAA